MKKFYKQSGFIQTVTGFLIQLDGKTVYTPMRAELNAPNLALAEEIKNEWDTQNQDILPDTMPITQMMMTIIDRIHPNREEFEKECLDYVDTDLLCYFSSKPENYASAQKKSWQPILDRLQNLMKCEIKTTSDLNALSQPPATKSKIRDYVLELDELKFSVLYLTTLTTGSLFLAITLIENSATIQEIYNAALIEDLTKDKIYLAEQYGISPDQERRRKIIKTELETSKKFLSLV
ncbi:MAG: hypothetical protein KDJ26_01275 [Alphaproteobacteria bacterium]|nr:hypothetical protein [Alphaproteobacteria bacterium]MCB9985475.1 hypothetical protein [Micavibrio sp.]HPQ50329.1 ATP12 family protein [Alphaproteobacteria bacterium]HRK98705.1 ATP12 family protein [Alphaproteobacteria bacterium]